MRTVFIILVILSIYIMGCQKNHDNIQINPELQIAQEINNRIIVMLGENIHGNPFGYDEVIKIIYEWLYSSIKSGNKFEKLNLVLELDDSIATEINNYVHTGDLSVLFDRYLLSHRYEEIEFYSKLKNINDTINSLLSVNQSMGVKLNVLGFEEIGSYLSPEFLMKSNLERQLWFIKERDSVLSLKIINHIIRNKNDKYLFYYGTFHLQKGLINKNINNFSISEDSSMGYCLANYLKNEFGEKNVLTIGGGMAPDRFYEVEKYKSLIDKTFYIKNDELIPFFKNASNIDYFLFSPMIITTDHIFNFIYCKKTFEKSIDILSYYDNSVYSESTIEFSKSILRKLSYLKCREFQNLDELKSWCSKKQYYDLNYFDSEEFSKYVFDIYSKDVNNTVVKNDLIRLGIDDKFFSNTSLDTVEWNKNIWPEAVKNIKFINAIGIYWAGYPDEKIRAKEYLKQFSKEDFAEPEKYLQWWRNVYHNFGV